jgi:hypothetical protein
MLSRRETRLPSRFGRGRARKQNPRITLFPFARRGRRIKTEVLAVQSGSFTSAGVSALAYVPPVANSTYFITVGGNAAGYIAVLTQTLSGGAQTLVTDPVGNPIVFAAPGGYQLSMPYTNGQPTPTYNVVCKRIQSGTLQFTFSP